VIDQRLKIAVFIDFDNIEIGVKTTLHAQFDIAAILEGIKERGEVVTKVAYGDWKRAGDYGRLLSQHAIRMVQRNLTPGGDKNGADINLALDALEMAFTHDHINAFVIVGGDSDFITLVEKLKQYDKKVFVVGGRQFTSQVMQKNCHEFIAYENLVRRRDIPPGPRRESSPASPAAADVAKAIPLVKRALKVLTDREVSPQLGLLKSTLLQLDSTFSERDYGVSTFRDFIEKVAKTGLVTLRHSGRSMIVDAVEGADGVEPGPAVVPSAADMAPAETDRQTADVRLKPDTPSSADTTFRPDTTPRPDTAPSPGRSAAELQQMAAEIRGLFGRAAQAPRWPMYVRQLKQYLRVVDNTFDERKWGFATIMELLRILQREGVLRLERDRRGQMRVFPGASLQSASYVTAPAAVVEPVAGLPDMMAEETIGQLHDDHPADAGSSMDADETVTSEEQPVDAIDVEEGEPIAAKPRRTRKTGGRSTTRKPSAAKPGARRRRTPGVPA
jgi:uncharacterized LabA/DUF88 family protein